MVLQKLLIIGALAGAVFSTVADSNSATDSGRKVADACKTCHGLNGVAKIPIAPHISGEPAVYLVSQLLAFRDGSRSHEMMTVVAKSLSDEQIAAVAAWYSSFNVEAVISGSVDIENAPETCVACHGHDGIATVEGVPNLAGENTIYIQTQLKAFRHNKRQHELMSAIAANLGDDEISEYAKWYSSFDLKIVSE